MEGREKKFRIKSEEYSLNSEYRKTITHNLKQYKKAVNKGRDFYSSLDNAKSSASKVKDYVLNNLDKLLIEFEKNAIKNGIEVLWASTINDAVEHVIDIVGKEEAKLVVKSKSMISEELELNHVLETNGVRSVETDLGEFIVQQAGEKPFHILTPTFPLTGGGTPYRSVGCYAFCLVQSAIQVVICRMSARNRAIEMIRQAAYATRCTSILRRLCPRKTTIGTTAKDSNIRIKSIFHGTGIPDNNLHACGGSNDALPEGGLDYRTSLRCTSLHNEFGHYHSEHRLP